MDDDQNQYVLKILSEPVGIDETTLNFQEHDLNNIEYKDHFFHQPMKLIPETQNLLKTTIANHVAKRENEASSLKGPPSFSELSINSF